MIEQIAMWGGVAGVVVAVIAIIVLFLTRANILDILEKDVILFDKNFELKKQAIEKSLNLIDELENNGEQIRFKGDFADRANQVYNELLCVVSDVRLADQFLDLTTNEETKIDAIKVAQFKLACRKDIGLKTNKSTAIKIAKKNGDKKITPTNEVPFVEQKPVMQPRQVQPVQPVARPVSQQPMARPTQPVARPVQTNQQVARPVAQQSVARPTQPVARPVVKRD